MGFDSFYADTAIKSGPPAKRIGLCQNGSLASADGARPSSLGEADKCAREDCPPIGCKPWVMRSEILGESILVAPNNFLLKSQPDIVLYRERELAILLEETEDMPVDLRKKLLRAVHSAKKLLDGTVI